MEGPPRRGCRRGRLLLGGQPPTLDLIENPLFNAHQRSNTMQYHSTQHHHPSHQDSRLYGSSVSSDGATVRQAEQSNNATGDQPKLSRSETVKRYIRKGTASFFGLDEESAPESCQRWTLRRKRLLSKHYGDIKDQYMRSKDWHLSHLQPLRPPQDTTDSVEVRRSVSARETSSEPFHRDPVYKLTWDGLSFLSTEVRKRLSVSGAAARSAVARQTSRRSFLPVADDVAEDSSDISGLQRSQGESEDLDDVFFDVTPSGSACSTASAGALQQPTWPVATEQTSNGRDRHSAARASQAKAVWQRPASVQPAEDVVDSPLPTVGMRRICDKVLQHAMDNSDRREYGMGLVGRILKRSFRRDRITQDVKDQLDEIEDHRPYFTYWVTTVQILIAIISLAVYGLGPIGFHKTQRTSLVMVTTLTLQQVDFYEPDNFWIGPRAADLVHLGAKFTPCMRRDRRIHDSIAKDRRKERTTACCIRNDRSGCVQTSRDKCSEVISTWRKWNVSQPGPPRWVADPSAVGSDRSVTQRRLSGSVCGQDPRYCEEPASVFPYEWPDDITRWPVCRRPQWSRKAPDAHMSCEVVGRPCCIGVYGECHITTRDYCDFVRGFFHEEAALCSQVSCLNDVCGMIPFHNPEVPDQFYRLWTSLFLHAGIFHLTITVIVQLFVMRDLEKLAGPVRTAIIYMSSGVAGNLASAIFVPYRAEVGPAGSQFGLLACLFVEVIHCWQMLRRPSSAFLKLVAVAVALFTIGLLPWVDNYAHLFGFIFGFLLAYALLPFVSFGSYDRTTKVVLICLCLVVAVALFLGLVVLFYVHPIYECSFCHYFNCLPITQDLCDSHRINVTRQDT
ncbi:inactive rhomboid protein 1-like isoform X2 [Ornithodoros turicata]